MKVRIFSIWSSCFHAPICALRNKCKERLDYQDEKDCESIGKRPRSAVSQYRRKDGHERSNHRKRFLGLLYA